MDLETCVARVTIAVIGILLNLLYQTELYKAESLLLEGFSGCDLHTRRALLIKTYVLIFARVPTWQDSTT